MTSRRIVWLIPLPSNKRMDQSWRGRAVRVGWHDRPCSGKFAVSSRATLVMRGR